MAAVADEGRLARAAAAGDGAAFAALYDSYEKRIYNFCLRLVGSQEDAADATQDAFVKVLQRLPKITGELNFGAYLFTAARNASYDIIGRRKRAEPVEEIGDVSGRPLHGDERGHIDLDPERAAMLAALQESVQAANARLPERQREVLALRELDEMSYDDIAVVMDMNRNSVAQLISRARIKLRDELVGSALASVSSATPDCQRALPLIAMRQDGQLDDADDKAWLKAHIADCATCKVSIDAMEEAGVSYRAWAPIVPLLWLRKATIAKAAQRTGFNWSDAADSPRNDPEGGHGSGGPGDGGGGAQLAGVGAAGAGSGVDASTAADEGGSEGGHRRRRAAFALLGLVLLGVIVSQLLIKDHKSTPRAASRANETFAPIVTPNPTAVAPVAVVHHHEARKKHHALVRHHQRHHTVVVTSTPSTSSSSPTTTEAVVISSSPVHHTPTHHKTPTHHTTTVHTGTSTGSSGTKTNKARPTVTPTSTATPPPPTTTEAAAPPPVTTTTQVTPPPVTTTASSTGVLAPPPTRPRCRPGAVGCTP